MGYLLPEKVLRGNIFGEALEEQPPEDEVWFVIIRKKSKHPVHQVKGLLISRERKGDQGLESLIIVQYIEQTRHRLRPARKRAAPSKCWFPAELLLKLRMGEKELRYLL